jgi:hypothetical protein
MKLYELGEAYRLISRRIEETEGSETAEDVVLKAALDSIEDGIENKAQSIVVLAKEWEAEAAAIKEEESRLARRRKALENRADSIRGYLLAQLLASGIEKLKTKLFSITVNKAKKIVVVGDVEMLPQEFYKLEKTPLKVVIKEAIEAGHPVPGAHLEDGERSMTVR